MNTNADHDSFGADQLLMIALASIGKIELRDYPQGHPVTRMHSSYKSDIRMVKSFCRNRRVFGRASAYLRDKFDIVLYLEPPYFLFYLPAILRAGLEFPDQPIADTVMWTAFPQRNRDLSLHQLLALAREITSSLISLRSGGYEGPVYCGKQMHFLTLEELLAVQAVFAYVDFQRQEIRKDRIRRWGAENVSDNG